VHAYSQESFAPTFVTSADVRLWSDCFPGGAAAGAVAATGLMAKQMLLAAPALCMLGAVALSHLLSEFCAQLLAPTAPDKYQIGSLHSKIDNKTIKLSVMAPTKAGKATKRAGHGAPLPWQKEAATGLLVRPCYPPPLFTHTHTRLHPTGPRPSSTVA
jgi:hypothetical protein